MTSKRGKSTETPAAEPKDTGSKSTAGKRTTGGSRATKAAAPAKSTGTDKTSKPVSAKPAEPAKTTPKDDSPASGAGAASGTSKIPASGSPASTSGTASADTKDASGSKTGTVKPEDIAGARAVTTTRTSSFVRVAAWLVLFVAALGAVGTVTAPWWTERLGIELPFAAGSSEDDPLIAQLMGRMAELEKRASALEQAGAGGAAPSPDDVRAAVAGDLDGVLSRVNELEQALSQARTDFAERIKSSETTLPLNPGDGTADRSIQELSDRLANLEAGGGRMESLLQRLDRLEARRQSADQTVGTRTSELSSALEDVNDRLRQLEAARPPSTPSEMGARAVVLAVAQLRDSLRAGRAYQVDLDALKAIAQRTEAIAEPLAVLQTNAADGIPTLAVLHGQFRSLAGQIVTASGQTPEGGSWVSRTADRLTGLVKVRRVGEAAPEGSVDRLVSDADALMKAGDLRSALETLAGLPNQGADVLAGWTTQAQARLEAERALAALHIHAVALLGPPETASAGTSGG